jgi:hypothetical protein
MVGSVLPDVMKMGILLELMGADWWSYIKALHIPAGSILLGGIISLFFREKKLAFLFLTMGIITHFTLDMLLIQMSGGIYFLFPVNWATWHLDLFPSDDYWVTLLALMIAFLVYLTSKQMENRAKKSI